jgi:hypothetical protein
MTRGNFNSAAGRLTRVQRCRCERRQCEFGGFGMSQDARDLRNAGLYHLVASAVLAAGVVLGGAFVAERAIVNPAVAEIVNSAFAETGSSLETMRMPTRLSVVVANAREIRDALAKPHPPLAPLPPITEKLAYGHLKPGSRVAQSSVTQRPLKLKQEAMNAMASAGPQPETRGPASAPVDLHRVY